MYGQLPAENAIATLIGAKFTFSKMVFIYIVEKKLVQKIYIKY